MPAYEMKPRIDNILFYIKVTLQEQGTSDERCCSFPCIPTIDRRCKPIDRRENNGH